MRRKDKEINGTGEIVAILQRARICHIAFCDSGVPYVVPMNYGYDGRCLYLHSAREGRKIEIIRSNNLASFSVFIDEEQVKGETACRWTMKYRSVLGQGRITLIEDNDDKEAALRIIMRQQAGEGEYRFERASLDGLTVLRLDIEQVTGKKSGYP